MSTGAPTSGVFLDPGCVTHKKIVLIKRTSPKQRDVVSIHHHHHNNNHHRRHCRRRNHHHHYVMLPKEKPTSRLSLTLE